MADISELEAIHEVLTPKMIALLRQASVKTLPQFLALSPEQISSVLSLPYTSIIDIREAILKKHAPIHFTALQLYQKSLATTPSPLTTGCPALDSLLGGGGLQGGVIYEVFGGPGAGKTQLCISTAAFCCMWGGIVAYIDSKGDFCPERLQEVVLVNSEDESIGEKGALKKILDGVKVARIITANDLLTAIELVKSLQPKLVVIDNLTFPIMPLLTENEVYTAMVHGSRVTQSLRKFVTNPEDGKLPPTVLVTSNLRAGREDDPIPALGRVWRGLADVRLILSQESGNMSRASIVRGGVGECFIKIGPKGLF